MTLKKSLLIYIKIPLLIALVGAFYWRDFPAFWQRAISTEWIVFTLVILSLFLVFLFQRRNALETLFSMSESHNGQGAAFMLLAMLLYIIGSYTPYAVWFHLCSLILFTASYLALIIDFRVLSILFLPLVALIFVVPPFGIEVFNVQNLLTLIVLYLSLDAVILALLTDIATSSRFRRMKATGFFEQFSSQRNETKGVDCPLCLSDQFKKEVFCFHCGRQRLPVKLKPFKFAFMKFSVLLLFVLVLSFVYVPIFSLVDREASLLSYTPHGIEEQTIIPALGGWKFESSERLTDYENKRLEDFVLVATYIREGFSENKSYIQLEIGSGTLYMRNQWQLPDWQRSSQDITLTQPVKGRYVVLQEGNNSIAVLYWTMQLIFKVGHVFSLKNVGVSIFSNFTKPITEPKIVEVLAEFRRVGISIINWWDSVSHWTLNFHILSQIYVRFRDIFLTVVGVGAVIMFVGWVRTKDEKVDWLTENAFIVMEDEATLLVAISKLDRKRFLGKELFDFYQRIAEYEVDLRSFYKRLRKLLMLGLIGKDYALKNGELIMVWKRMFP